MTEYELTKEHGWQEVGEYWFHPCDGGLMHERAHTLDEAINRTVEAVARNCRVTDIWVLPKRTVEDGIRMGFIHPPRHLSVVKSSTPNND